MVRIRKATANVGRTLDLILWVSGNHLTGDLGLLTCSFRKFTLSELVSVGWKEINEVLSQSQVGVMMAQSKVTVAVMEVMGSEWR